MNLLLGVLAALLLYAAVRWFLQRAPRYGKAFLLRLLLVPVAALVIWMALTGRLHWLAVVAGALLPFARRLLPYLIPLLRLLPFFQQQRRRHQAGQRSQGQQSRVQTRWLSMTLDHDSGDIEGEITAGPYAGKTLEMLDIEALQDFYRRCAQEDPEAIRLLDAYIQRHRQEQWQRQASGEQSQDRAEGPALSLNEAWDILGLEPGASREEVLRAYKRIMLKVHPDRGGSNYLAARINAAKELLLKQFH